MTLRVAQLANEKLTFSGLQLFKPAIQAAPQSTHPPPPPGGRLPRSRAEQSSHLVKGHHLDDSVATLALAHSLFMTICPRDGCSSITVFTVVIVLMQIQSCISSTLDEAYFVQA